MSQRIPKRIWDDFLHPKPSFDAIGIVIWRSLFPMLHLYLSQILLSSLCSPKCELTFPWRCRGRRRWSLPPSRCSLRSRAAQSRSVVLQRMHTLNVVLSQCSELGPWIDQAATILPSSGKKNKIGRDDCNIYFFQHLKLKFHQWHSCVSSKDGWIIWKQMKIALSLILTWAEAEAAELHVPLRLLDPLLTCAENGWLLLTQS